MNIYSQSKLESFIEAVLNVVVSFVMNVVLQLLVLPLFGIEINMVVNLSLAAIFTGAHILKTYVIRRYFDSRIRKKIKKYIG